MESSVRSAENRQAGRKFEVRTPAGVAGVVGTDFFVAFDNTTGTMNVITFEDW